MHKFFKLSAVSVLAIVAASNANAAGYTCEELIEYTSCNTGYALVNSDCVRTCDAGYYLNGTACTICPIGTYSLAAATSCTTCPSTGLTDKNGTTVVATTVSAGATGLSSCIIPSTVEFKDSTGSWHFKSSCAYSGQAGTAYPTDTGDYEEIYCTESGGVLDEEAATCTCPAGYVFTYNHSYCTDCGACVHEKCIEMYNEDDEGSYLWGDYEYQEQIGICVRTASESYTDCLAQGGQWTSANTCDCGAGKIFAYSTTSDGGKCVTQPTTQSECENIPGNAVWSNGTCVCSEQWYRGSGTDLSCGYTE